MTRYLLRIEYDGAPFWGWQRQDNGPTVQGTIETAAKKLTGQETLVYGAGRTAKRYYRYEILNRRADLTLDDGLVWRIPYALNTDDMQEAANLLIGRHDFSTFRDTQCQSKSPVKTLDALEVTRMGTRVVITCSALSFLHKQVRSMVGSLVEVGRGQQSVAWLGEALAAKERTACGPVAPPDGLYLEHVDYPDLQSPQTPPASVRRVEV